MTEVPGREPLKINCVVLNYNGTAAVNGTLLKGVKEHIARPKEPARVHVFTADTYDAATRQCEPLGITAKTPPWKGAAGCREEIVKGLEGGVTCLGNDFNGMQTFDAAQLSITALEREGMRIALLNHVSVVVRSIEGGLGLLLKPDRLRATLRNWRAGGWLSFPYQGMNCLQQSTYNEQPSMNGLKMKENQKSCMVNYEILGKELKQSFKSNYETTSVGLAALTRGVRPLMLECTIGRGG